MKSICIFCGASWGRKKEFEQAAITLSKEIVRRGYRVVYGGSSVGLMGVVADAALEAGGEVIGVLPDALMRKEVDHKGLTELHIVDSMHTRKAMMVELSDGFVSLPGGAGTMDEMFEVWTWGMLGWHGKPSALLNVDGYYDHLIKFFDNMVAEAFVKQGHRDMLIVEEEVTALLDRMEGYQAPQNVGKWITKESQT
ncbi:TIGR00730 family Rossman fold protein [Cohaesibacter sp. CAU 1516]|uniref:LOG family protein n=1 Tax=Cohaesibacter sp. CAU 1516 TaxID=2576038 RepID=UPI0010FDE63A|nr:TIGR00730 family Rossman fold protein [Cohaesibacter sp. CAU 1516]TLP44861.1 TIGR00730 family Rossman fold protein [Cohaesibacter sp. CAU 1516]